MGDKKKKSKGKKQNKGGFGRKLLVFVVLVGAAIGAGFYLQPELMSEQLGKLRAGFGDEAWADSRFDEAAALFEAMSTSEQCEDFLTLPAYDRILTLDG